MFARGNVVVVARSAAASKFDCFDLVALAELVDSAIVDLGAARD
jgi:hypothetical protein